MKLSGILYRIRKIKIIDTIDLLPMFFSAFLQKAIEIYLDISESDSL
jgi:hypothetical protein